MDPYQYQMQYQNQMHNFNANPRQGMYGGASFPAERRGQDQPHTNDQGKVVFVGNLSFFCEEQHLRELAMHYSRPESVRVIWNDDNTKSLMFGFVRLSTPQEAEQLERALDGMFFMGRHIRACVSEKRFDGRYGKAPEGIQVHCSFCSFFHATDPAFIRPTEVFLRNIFVGQGNLVDVCVKDYQIYKETNMQEGYSFLTFATLNDAQRVCNSFANTTIDGITLFCALTHQHNPNSKKGKRFNNKMGGVGGGSGRGQMGGSMFPNNGGMNMDMNMGMNMGMGMNPGMNMNNIHRQSMQMQGYQSRGQPRNMGSQQPFPQFSGSLPPPQANGSSFSHANPSFNTGGFESSQQIPSGGHPMNSEMSLGNRFANRNTPHVMTNQVPLATSSYSVQPPSAPATQQWSPSNATFPPSSGSNNFYY